MIEYLPVVSIKQPILTGPGPKLRSSINSDVVPQPFEVHGIYSFITIRPVDWLKTGWIKNIQANKRCILLEVIAFIGVD